MPSTRATADAARRTAAFLAELGLPDGDLTGLADSTVRFDDGAHLRLEIPSTEGPDAMAAVLDEADRRGVVVNRVSQGSGIMLLDDAEITDMVAMGAERDVEVCLFVGPRAGWDVGVQATTPAGRNLGASLRGADGLVAGCDDVLRAADLGVRSVLVADVGQLWVLARMKERGLLPADFVLKVSVSLAVANPATARVLEELGATTLNLPVDLSVAQIAAIRQATDLPIDLYIEAADEFGGVVRYHDLPEIVRTAAPVYVKFTVRNAPPLYPAGGHMAALVTSLARERVRRAAIGLALLSASGVHAVQSGVAAADTVGDR